jgi:hypothetical protein
MLGLHLVLVTLYRGLQITFELNKIGDTKYHI